MHFVLRCLKAAGLLCFVFCGAVAAGPCYPPFAIDSGFIGLHHQGWPSSWIFSFASDLSGCGQTQENYPSFISFSIPSSTEARILDSEDGGPQEWGFAFFDQSGPGVIRASMILSFHDVLPDLTGGFPPTLSLTSPFTVAIDMLYGMIDEPHNRPFSVHESRTGFGTGVLNLTLAQLIPEQPPQAVYLSDNATFTFEPVPEPRPFVLFAAGLTVLLVAARRPLLRRLRPLRARQFNPPNRTALE